MKTYIHNHFNAFDNQLDPMLASFVAIEQQQRIALRKQQKKHKRNLQYLSLFLLMSIMCFVYQLYHALTNEGLYAFSPMIKVPAIYQLSPNIKEPSAPAQPSDLKSHQEQLSTTYGQSQSQYEAQVQALGQCPGQGYGHSRSQNALPEQALAQKRAQDQAYAQDQAQAQSHEYGYDYGQAQVTTPHYERHFAPVIEPETPSALYEWFLPEQALLLSKSLDEDGIRSLTNLLEGLKQGNPYFKHHEFSNGEQWAYQGELLIKTPLRNPIVRKVKNNNGLEPFMQPYPYQDFKDWDDILAMVAAVQKEIHYSPNQPLTGQPPRANH